MSGRFAAVSAGIMSGLIAAAAFSPAPAGELKPEEAKRFVAEKLFSYTCSNGINGGGWIHSDGSMVGTIQAGSGPDRHVSLPSGTIRLTSDSICASLRGAMFQPCFNVVQTSPLSFRGSIRGLDFAYCDFVHRNASVEITADEGSRRHAHEPLSLLPSRY